MAGTRGRPATGQREKVHSVVDRPIYDCLKAEAERRGLGVSTVIREILMEWHRRSGEAA